MLFSFSGSYELFFIYPQMKKSSRKKFKDIYDKRKNKKL
eukprot:UN16628